MTESCSSHKFPAVINPTLLPPSCQLFNDSTSPHNPESLHRCCWRGHIREFPIIRLLYTIKCHAHLESQRLITSRLSNSCHAPDLPRPLQCHRIPIHNSKHILHLVSNIRIPCRHCIHLALDLVYTECWIRALDVLEFGARKNKFQSTDCVCSICR